MIFFVQGAFVHDREARVSVLDRGFLYGDSIYETVRALGGGIVFWDDHLARLHRSADLLGYSLEPHPYDLLEVTRSLLARNNLADARMRIIVSRGTGDRDQIDGFTATYVVIVEAFQPLSEEEHRRGVSAVLSTIRRHSIESLNPEIKSSNLLNNLLARQEARRAGAAEGVMCNAAGMLAEGAHSNLFWVSGDGRLATPSADVGILPGVTRHRVMEAARILSVELEETASRPEVLDEAEEIFLTSTSWEVLSVTNWNGKPVGDGRRGPVARALHEGLRALYDAPGGRR